MSPSIIIKFNHGNQLTTDDFNTNGSIIFNHYYYHYWAEKKRKKKWWYLLLEIVNIVVTLRALAQNNWNKIKYGREKEIKEE